MKTQGEPAEQELSREFGKTLIELGELIKRGELKLSGLALLAEQAKGLKFDGLAKLGQQLKDLKVPDGHPLMVLMQKAKNFDLSHIDRNNNISINK